MLNLYWMWRALLIFTVLFLAMSHLAKATHIVGGELELRYLGAQSAFSHRINLNLYFDVVNGDPGADDGLVTVGIFSKRTNQLIGYVPLNRISSEQVLYTRPACANASVSTRLIRHSIDVNLDPNVFSDAAGYYMSWERCCRNGTISNILTPSGAGSTFYLEFPAIGTGANRYVNSSPVFTVPKGDYACIGQPFTLDFSAKDSDGDSLAYRLVTPYNGYSTTNLPNPGALNRASPIFYPGPYPTVRWSTGISEANEIPGAAPLRVNNRTGILTVTPDRAGLFVFSVEVTEYRAGKAIGLVRRDYQVTVIDCPKNNAPKLLFKPEGQKSFYQAGTVLTIAEKDTNCLTLYLTDIDINQRVTVTNMSGSLPGLTVAPGELFTRTSHDTLQAKFCFGRCVGGNGVPITLLIRATDDGCPQGLSDTLSIRLNIIPSPNNKPLAGTDLRNNQGKVTVGTSLTFNAFGTDIDNDNVTIQAVGRGFTLSQAEMSFSSASGVGKVTQPFTWKPTCTQAMRSEYIVDFIVTDTRCGRNLRDTVTVNLSAIGLPSQPPNIRTTLPQPVVELTVSPGDSAGFTLFDVLGNDPDRDTLLLSGVGRGFTMQAVGMNFSNKTGMPVLQSAFSWKPTCELMAGRTEATFVVDFVVDDRSCQPHHADTTSVTFHVKSPVSTTEIKVPNVFTPNGDGVNDYFAVQNMPENSCAEQFKSVEISNRWGQPIFKSSDPFFKWYGNNAPSGTYYYLILTTARTVKGPVTIMR